VLRFHIDDALFDNYKIDAGKLHPIGRMGGPTYTRTTDRFDMSRPQTGEIKPRKSRAGRNHERQVDWEPTQDWTERTNVWRFMQKLASRIARLF